MKNLIKNSFFILLILLFVSCKNEKNSKDAQEEIKTEQHHENETSDLQLDGDQRWYVNEEMKPFVRSGEESVKKYLENNSKDYKNLAAQLKEKNNQLIKSCTMTGRSHDELHNWLHPHLELVAELAKTENPDQAEEIVHQIEQSYQTYHQYFQ